MQYLELNNLGFSRLPNGKIDVQQFARIPRSNSDIDMRRTDNATIDTLDSKQIAKLREFLNENQ